MLLEKRGRINRVGSNTKLFRNSDLANGAGTEKMF
jgi:hypothetical protein